MILVQWGMFSPNEHRQQMIRKLNGGEKQTKLTFIK